MYLLSFGTTISTKLSLSLILFSIINGALAPFAILDTHCSLSLSGPISNGFAILFLIHLEINFEASSVIQGML